jgi:hypothetical protein
MGGVILLGVIADQQLIAYRKRRQDDRADRSSGLADTGGP